MSERNFDPEVLALLDEIARSPDGTLLRIPRQPLLRAAGRPIETITPQAAHLTKAERHLVTVYREQAAWVLLDACSVQLRRDPLIYTGRMSVEARGRSRIETLLSGLGQHESRREVQATRDGESLTASSLAFAALRLAPIEAGVNALALAHQQEGNLLSSIQLLRSFSASNGSSFQRARAAENLARAFSLRGEHLLAFQNNLIATELDERTVRFRAYCLTAAIQTGDEHRSLESALRLEQHPQESELGSVVEGLRTSRAMGLWNPTPASMKLIPQIRDRVSSRCGEICATFE